MTNADLTAFMDRFQARYTEKVAANQAAEREVKTLLAPHTTIEELWFDGRMVRISRSNVTGLFRWAIPAVQYKGGFASAAEARADAERAFG